jgi:hypothetical protein
MTEIKWQVLVAAMICITFLMGYALSLGMNGMKLTATIGAICVLAGAAVPKSVFGIK